MLIITHHEHRHIYDKESKRMCMCGHACERVNQTKGR